MSVAWTAALKVLGLTLPAWEPDTIRIELERVKIPPTDALMAKLLGAQTVVTGPVWSYDHDVLFSLALACDGVPAAADCFAHPTPEQLCWLMHELNALTGHTFTEDDGFDPDTIDPAIAVVLHDEGMPLAPPELSFAQDALARLLVGEKDLPAKVLKGVDQPLLVVQGLLDTQVPPDNADKLEALAKARHKSSVEVVKVAGVNHLLVPAKTGEVDEYPRLGNVSVSPDVTGALTTWLKKTLAAVK